MGHPDVLIKTPVAATGLLVAALADLQTCFGGVLMMYVRMLVAAGTG